MEALECQSITKIYTSGLIRKKMIFGAKNVSFRIRRSEIVGLVGESGSGKTTVARMILRLIEPTSGDILLDGESIFSYKTRILHATHSIGSTAFCTKH
jgi:ABC-type oligopeptide transport system ATPase subunit